MSFPVVMLPQREKKYRSFIPKTTSATVVAPQGQRLQSGKVVTLRQPRSSGQAGRRKSKGTKQSRGNGSIPLMAPYRETKQTFRKQSDTDSNHEYLGVLSFSNTGTVTTTSVAAGTVIQSIPLNPSIVKPGGALDLDSRSWTRFEFLDWKLAFESGGSAQTTGVVTVYYEEDMGSLQRVLSMSNSERIARARSARFRTDFVMRGRSDGRPQIFEFKLKTPTTPLLVDAASTADVNLIYQGVVIVLAGLNIVVGTEYGTMEQRWSIRRFSRKLNSVPAPAPYAFSRFSGNRDEPFLTVTSDQSSTKFIYKNVGGVGQISAEPGVVFDAGTSSSTTVESCPSSFWQMPTVSDQWKITARVAMQSPTYSTTLGGGHERVQIKKYWTSNPVATLGGWYENITTAFFRVESFAYQMREIISDFYLMINTAWAGAVVVAILIENVAARMSTFLGIEDYSRDVKSIPLRKDLELSRSRAEKEDKKEKKERAKETVVSVSEPTSDDESVFVPKLPLKRESTVSVLKEHCDASTRK